jgi:sortase A
LNKYLLLTLALLIIAIFAFEPKNNEIMGAGTNHFDDGGISFDYPNEWNMTNGTGSLLASYSDTKGLNIKVFKFGLPPGYNLARNLQLDTAGTIDKSFQLVSQKNTTVNGTKAYEKDYTVNGTLQRKEVWIQKNNILYGIVLTTPNEMNVNLDSLVSSIKVNDSDDGPKYRGWAQIVLPEFNQKWIFSSYSLNDAGAVKHLSGFYPGEKGQLALIGHHTTHHAPFLYIKELKPGNQIIINDYLTQKKYTYVVTGSEVRMGVKGVDINYHATENPELWLITCWPPGYSRGAYIVHCELDSIEPLT